MLVNEFCADDGKWPDHALYQAYGRPMYMMNTSETANSVVFYTGSRWVHSNWEMSLLDPLLVPCSEPIHSYWHLDRQNNVSHFSDPTDSFYPFDFTWNVIRESRSTGTGQPFGDSVPDIAYNVCFFPPAHFRSPNYCGKFGSFDEASGHCNCSEAFGGPYCQFSPLDNYVSDQASRFVSAFQAGVRSSNNYTDFNGTVLYNPNFYHVLYWEKYTDEELYGFITGNTPSFEDEL